MKNIYLLALLCFTNVLLAQTLTGKVPVVNSVNQGVYSQNINYRQVLIRDSVVSSRISQENDSIITVVFKNKFLKKRKPIAIYINNVLVGQSILKTLNPNDISTYHVEKGEITLNNTTYDGKIYFVTKESYNPKWISLTELKLKHTQIKENPTVYQIDNEPIDTDDYDNYLTDENSILKIEVDYIEVSNENLKLNILNILTKTAENIRKSKEILIR